MCQTRDDLCRVVKWMAQVRAMEDLLLGQEWQQMDMRERQERESTYRHNGLHATRPTPPPPSPFTPCPPPSWPQNRNAISLRSGCLSTHCHSGPRRKTVSIQCQHEVVKPGASPKCLPSLQGFSAVVCLLNAMFS